LGKNLKNIGPLVTTPILPISGLSVTVVKAFTVAERIMADPRAPCNPILPFLLPHQEFRVTNSTKKQTIKLDNFINWFPGLLCLPQNIS